MFLTPSIILYVNQIFNHLTYLIYELKFYHVLNHLIYFICEPSFTTFLTISFI